MKTSISPRSESNRYRILEFIRDHPDGTTRRDIRRAFPGFTVGTIDSGLAFLRNKDLVYNTGVMGAKGSIWFPRMHEGVPAPFPAIAAELIAELREVHYAGQELHLAKRLHELFETPN